jgi:hypothetical protein
VNILLLRWLSLAFVVWTFTVLLSGCVLTTGGGYGYDDGGGIGAAYYEPHGVDYGGWGHGYQVAPFRGGDHRPTSGGGHAPAQAYRSAPASHSMPSIPSKSRSGGQSKSRSGGPSKSSSGDSRSR